MKLLCPAAIVVATVVVAAWVRRSLDALSFGIGGIDSLWFHLPISSTFLQNGSILELSHFDVEFVTAPFYPANSELLTAVGSLLFRNHEPLAAVMNVGWLVLAILAAWCIGRSRGVAPFTMLAALPVVGSPVMVVAVAGEAKSDIMAVALFLAAVALIVEFRHVRGGLLLAGLAAGMAVGTQLTMLAPVASLWVGVVAVHGGPGRGRLALEWFAAAIAGGGIWYLRNLVHTGNPLPWLGLGPLPSPAEGHYADTDFTVFNYLTDIDVIREFFGPGLEDGFGVLWPLTLALALTGLVVATLAPGDDRLLRRLGLVGLASLGAYLVTPFSAGGPEGEPFGFGLNVRYAAPALLIGLMLLPMLPQLRNAVSLTVLGGVLTAIVGAAQFADGTWPRGHRALTLLVLAAGFVAWMLFRIARRQPLSRPALAGCAAALVAVGLIAGYPAADRYVTRAYTGTGQTSSWHAFGLTGLFAWSRQQQEARIGVGGTLGSLFQHPLYGRDLSNEVQRIGVEGENGSYLAVETCGQWRRLVNDGNYDFLVTTPRTEIWNRLGPAPRPETEWTEEDPAVSQVLSGPNAVVFRVDGELSPSACQATSG